MELVGRPEKGFRRVAILLTLEKTLAEPVLRVRDQGIAGVFLREVAHGLFREGIVLALHIADTEIELVLRGCRRRQGGEPAGGVGIARRRRRQAACRIARAAGVCQIERAPRSASPGTPDPRFPPPRHLTPPR